MKWLVVAAMALLAACSRSAPEDRSAGGAPAAAEKPRAAKEEPAAAKGEPAAAKEESEALVLNADEIRALGITTAAVRSVTYSSSPEGFGVILSHELVAQVAADLQTARAAVRQSEAAFSRAQRLAGTPGALGADVQQTAARQLAADRAAQSLAESKLTVTLGQHFPSADGLVPPATLTELADGRIKLIRVTFPPGVLAGEAPKQLRISPLDGSAAESPGFLVSEVWLAPQDSTIPGRSFFGLVRRADMEEGVRLGAEAVAPSSVAGSWIPASAVVISNGLSWCYVATKPGTYVRTPMDISRPLGGGYFVTNIASGDQVVTSAAGLLLARQTGSGTASED